MSGRAKTVSLKARIARWKARAEERLAADAVARLAADAVERLKPLQVEAGISWAWRAGGEAALSDQRKAIERRRRKDAARLALAGRSALGPRR